MRLIDADLFKEKFTGQYEFMQRVIDDEPTVDATPIIHARWKGPEEPPFIKGVVCTNCGQPTFVAGNFCPNCGAKMDLK